MRYSGLPDEGGALLQAIAPTRSFAVALALAGAAGISAVVLLAVSLVWGASIGFAAASCIVVPLVGGIGYVLALHAWRNFPEQPPWEESQTSWTAWIVLFPLPWIASPKVWPWVRRGFRGYIQALAVLYCGFLLFWCIAAIAFTLQGIPD